MVGDLLYPVLSLGVIAFLFGTGLALASKYFAVEQDSRQGYIREALPGANCGACGYAGCDAFAEAVAKGKAPVDGCPVGAGTVAQKVAEIMGVNTEVTARKVAKVLCQGDCEQTTEKFKYIGIDDCVAAANIMEGSKKCSYGCLGLGTCEKVCPFDAIHVNDKGIAIVDKEKCTACNMCVVACPKNIIELVPYSSEVQVTCMSYDKGKNVRLNCKVGCIACKICEKACNYDAIHVEDNLAKIDYNKCTNCMICADKCPTNAIYADFSKRNEDAV